MKCIGIIGGMSPESTVHYYERINRQVTKRAGGLTTAELVLRSVNFGEYTHLMDEGRWQYIGVRLSYEAEKLAYGSGCDYIALATNTMHKVAPLIKSRIEGSCIDSSDCCPKFVHIGDCIAEKLKEAGARRILFLGTKTTMTEDFMKDYLLEQHGIKTIDVKDYPEEVEEINRIIFEELCRGIVMYRSRKHLMDFIRNFTANDLPELRPEAIVLGCTELDMILGPADVDIPLVDSTQVHIDKLVELCLSD